MRVDGQSDADKGDTETRNFGEPQGVKVASVGFKRVDIMAELLPMFTNRDPMKLFLGPTRRVFSRRSACRLAAPPYCSARGSRAPSYGMGSRSSTRRTR
jgi:hypothetical protein